MSRPGADCLSAALERLKSLQPQWAIELALPHLMESFGDEALAYESKISCRLPGGIEVEMRRSSTRGQAQERLTANATVWQSYPDGSPRDEVFSWVTSDFSEPDFSLLSGFILAITEGARLARAQRCVEARRAFFGSK